jgi:probable HAF family extracellular repeat protein
MIARARPVTLFGLALAVVMAVAACHDAIGPRSSPDFQISDGGHGGNPHFFFLQPLVPSFPYSGTPAANLSPTVEVCELAPAGDCARVIAQFSKAVGTGSEVVRYETGGFYTVNWHTDRCLDGPCTLEPAKTYRLRVLVGALELGFADIDVVANGSQLHNVQTDEYIGLVNGRTLPVKFRIENGAVSVIDAGGSATVGANGGTIATSDGHVSLEFPAGAATAGSPISVSPASSAVPVPGPWAAPVDLGPDGSTFTRPVTLTMSFDAQKLPTGVPLAAMALYTLVDGGWVEVPGSAVNEVDNTVSAPIAHFSTYAVSIRPNQVNGVPAPTTLTVGQTTSLTGYGVSFVTVPSFYCYQSRTWVPSLFGGYWQYSTICYTTTSTYVYPLANYWAFWSQTNAAVLSIGGPGRTVSDQNGNFVSPPLTAIAVGTSTVLASVAGTVSNTSVTLTIIPSLVLQVSHGNVPGLFPDAMRDLGVHQAFGLYPRLPSPASAPVAVSFSHTGNALTLSPGTTIPAGATSALGATVIGGMAGVDTIIGSAAGYGPDTVIVTVGTGSMRVVGWPRTLNTGDSVPLRIEPIDPSGRFNDGGYGLNYAFHASSNLRFSDGRFPITGIRFPDATYSTATFYVTAIGTGHAVLDVIEPFSGTISLAFDIAAQPIHLQPRALTTVAGWVFGEAITIGASLPADADVAITSVNHLTVGEAGTSNYTYPGQTGHYTLRAGTNSKTLSIAGLDGPGIDTLIASGTGFLPDTAVVTLVQGTVLINGLPATLQEGDSVALQLTVANDHGIANGSLGYPIDLASHLSPGLALSDGHAPITSVNVQQRTSATFYLKALAAGARTIGFTHRDYAPVDMPVLVTPRPVASIDVTPSLTGVMQGQTVQLAGVPRDLANQPVPGATLTWSSSNPGVASVDAAGLVTGNSRGAATISARYGSVTGTAIVNVGVPLPANPASQVEAGGKSTCQRKLSGLIRCWGESSFGATDPSPGMFTTIGGGGFHYCGIRPDQSLSCWGYNSDNRATPPSGSFRQLAVSAEHACALRFDDTAACWGFTADGRGLPPAGTYKQITTGWYHGCAIKPDDTVLCFGQNGQGQLAVPNGTFRSIEGAGLNTCGIRMDYSITCWGAIAAPPSGSFLRIGHSVGGHLCAIRFDHTLACWGQNDFGQADAPAGQFEQVSEGGWHSCGVKSDGTPVCWGSNATGAVVIPAYAVTDLGTAPGVQWAEARTLNLAGRVAGWGGFAFPSWQGWAWEPGAGSIANVGNPCGSWYMANDVNTSGTLAMNSGGCGYLFDPGTNLQGGSITNVPAPAGTNRSAAISLNDHGLVLACADNGSYAYNYVWDRGTNTLTIVPGGPANHCRGRLNNAGFAVVNGDQGGAWLWNVAANTLTALPGSGGYRDYAMDINDQNVVVGRSCLPDDRTCRAWRWTVGQPQLQDLGSLGGGTSVAMGINNAGAIVGWSTTATGEQHAYVWDPLTGVMTDLGTAGFTESVANDINDAGVIVGAGGAVPGITGRFWNVDILQTGSSHAIRWVPN